MTILNQKGFAVYFLTILVLIIAFGIALSLSFLAAGEARISRNIIVSSQAYYIAEAGIEDALLRIFDPQIPYSDSNTLFLEEGRAVVSITELSTSATVESQGEIAGLVRKIEARALVLSDEVNFHYGIQVGGGGLTMEGNSRVLGNIYSNGPIQGASNARIDGDAYSAGPAGAISQIWVYKSESGSSDGNAYAHAISNSNIENGAYYQELNNTTAGSYYPDSPDPEIKEMPIAEEQIVQWKDAAALGGTISGYYLGSNDEDSLGPIKVEGDLTITSNAVLTLTGSIWVAGNININSNAAIQLDGSYGINSGVMITDGKIFLEGNTVICGSEGYNSKKKECYPNQGSFLMLLSTNPSLDSESPAIEASSNNDIAVLYANQGLIKLNSNSRLKEVTGYASYLSSNAVVAYESGLADLNFTSGPGGIWQVVSWKETE